MSDFKPCVVCGARVTNINRKAETCSAECMARITRGRLSQRKQDEEVRRFSLAFEEPTFRPRARFFSEHDDRPRIVGL